VHRVAIKPNYTFVERRHPPLSVRINRQIQHLQAPKLRVCGTNFYGKGEALGSQ